MKIKNFLRLVLSFLMTSVVLVGCNSNDEEDESGGTGTLTHGGQTYQLYQGSLTYQGAINGKETFDVGLFVGSNTHIAFRVYTASNELTSGAYTVGSVAGNFSAGSYVRIDGMDSKLPNGLLTVVGGSAYAITFTGKDANGIETTAQYAGYLEYTDNSDGSGTDPGTDPTSEMTLTYGSTTYTITDAELEYYGKMGSTNMDQYVINLTAPDGNEFIFKLFTTTSASVSGTYSLTAGSGTAGSFNNESRICLANVSPIGLQQGQIQIDYNAQRQENTITIACQDIDGKNLVGTIKGKIDKDDLSSDQLIYTENHCTYNGVRYKMIYCDFTWTSNGNIFELIYKLNSRHGNGKVHLYGYAPTDGFYNMVSGTYTYSATPSSMNFGTITGAISGVSGMEDRTRYIKITGGQFTSTYLSGQVPNRIYQIDGTFNTEEGKAINAYFTGITE